MIGRRESNNPRIIGMVSTDRNFLHPDYDEYAEPTSRSLMCCRILAVIVSLSLPLHIYSYNIPLSILDLLFNLQFMVLLILRHTLPVIFSGAENYSFPLVMVKHNLELAVFSVTNDRCLKKTLLKYIHFWVTFFVSYY